jgi:DNA mismatch repair ATPase MutS
MQVDNTTLQDLSIFHHDEEQSVFHHLNFTHTNEGRRQLHLILSRPLESVTAIQDTQHTIRHLQEVSGHWPGQISNGTLMVLEKFFDTPMDNYPQPADAISSLMYTFMSKSDYSLTKYSVEHFSDFFKGLQLIADLLQTAKSRQLQTWSSKINLLLSKPTIRIIERWGKERKLKPSEILWAGAFILNHFKHETYELMAVYSKLDAYLSLALAGKKYGFCFPEISSAETFIEAKGLYHLQLQVPVAYDVHLNKATNFLFLTGANMGGKSTFIKAVGVCVYLGHIGMGVPAASMRMSYFDGLLSNINVVDNIIKGESFFFNEVQRIKNTIEKINDGKNWLVLIDELFKGTNMKDAMKCSTVVIEGLLKMPHALFVLSTHLYEIGEGLQKYQNILFQYFETSVTDDKLIFSYQLKEGISQDRLGYLILKREGVVEMLEKL